MERYKSSHMKQGNFGLGGNKQPKIRKGASYDGWFWESKEKKNLKNEAAKLENDSKRAQTEFARFIMNEEDTPGQSSSNVGTYAMVGAGILVLIVGGYFLLKKRSKATANGIPNGDAGTLTNADILL